MSHYGVGHAPGGASMGCQYSSEAHVVMRDDDEPHVHRLSLSSILLQAKQSDQPLSSVAHANAHRDVFSIFGEHGMALEQPSPPHDPAATANESSSCTPLSPVGSVFSTATTASDNERTHCLHGPADQVITPLNVSYGVYSDKGMRKANEDRHQCTSQRVQEDTVAFFGLYDGHGGHAVADYLAQHLHNEIFDRLKCAGPTAADLQQCLVDAFKAIDEQIFKAELASGSTAVVMLRRGTTAVIASVGDSQAVLSTSGKATNVCVAHTPSLSSERERILAARGQIVKGRIFGLLGVSRAFGDNDFKTGRGEFKSKFNGDLVIATPDVVQREIAIDDEFLVLGCDGLFDVMRPQQVVNFVRTKLALHGDVQHACEELVSHAISIGSTDNVSVVLVCFNQDTQFLTPVTATAISPASPTSAAAAAPTSTNNADTPSA